MPGDVVRNGSKSDCERQAYRNPTRYPNEPPGSTASHLLRRFEGLGRIDETDLSIRCSHASHEEVSTQTRKISWSLQIRIRSLSTLVFSF
jgi:hypothetical protein